MKSLWWCTLAARIALAQPNQPVDAGRALYQARCATCHAVDLGGGEGPQLVGANFRTRWGSRPPGELTEFIRTSMPPAAPGSLDTAASANLAAFILAANGTAAPVTSPATPAASPQDAAARTEGSS